MRYVLAGLLFVLPVTVAPQEKDKKDKKEEAPEATAKEICQGFQANPIAVEQFWKDKLIRIKGNIDRIVAPPKKGDDAALEFTYISGQRPEVVVCKFAPKHLDRLAKVAPGQEVFIRGEYDSHNRVAVYFKNCELMDGPQKKK